MTASRIDGKAIAADLRTKIATEAQALIAETGVVPGIAVVIVGDDPASQVYVASKGKAAKECNFHSVQHSLADDTTEEALLALIEQLNDDDAIHGILVQLPLPDHIDESKVINLIRPDKDVDGFHPINVGLLTAGERDKALVPCTPAGSLILAKRVLGDLSGKNAVVIGRSNIVGKPMAALLLAESCTVTIAHSRTKDLPGVVRVLTSWWRPWVALKWSRETGSKMALASLMWESIASLPLNEAKAKPALLVMSIMQAQQTMRLISPRSPVVLAL